MVDYNGKREENEEALIAVCTLQNFMQMSMLAVLVRPRLY